MFKDMATIHQWVLLRGCEQVETLLTAKQGRRGHKPVQESIDAGKEYEEYLRYEPCSYDQLDSDVEDEDPEEEGIGQN